MKLLVLPALLLSLTPAYADKIDDFVKAEMAKNRIPGMVVGIAKGGKLVSTRAYGFSDLEHDVKTTKDHLFEIGSITKQFTAFGTMILVEEGKINLDDPVSKFIPEAPAAWADIRIKHLLYQNSGLKDYAFVPGIGLVDDFDRAKWMGEMVKLDLDFKPGVAWAYSNSNYALLGWIIEKASGMPYDQFMTDRVLRPLGMTRTQYDDTYAIIKGRAHGYYNLDPKTQIRVKPGAMTIQSDGSLLTCIEDMAKWDAALREKKLLKPSSYEMLWAPVTLESGRKRAYGMGWNLTAPGSVPYVGHGGNSVGYSAGLARYPAADISVIVLGNVYAFNGEGTAKSIAELYDPKLRYVTPTATASDPLPARTGKLREAISSYANGKADETLLEQEITAPMKTQRAGMSQANSPLKKIDSLAFVSESAEGDSKWLVYRMKSGERMFTLYALWSKSEKLAQLVLRPDPPVVAKKS